MAPPKRSQSHPQVRYASAIQQQTTSRYRQPESQRTREELLELALEAAHHEIERTDFALKKKEKREGKSIKAGDQQKKKQGEEVLTNYGQAAKIGEDWESISHEETEKEREKIEAEEAIG